MDIQPDELAPINEALGRIGASPIYALDEDTPANDHVARQWPGARDHCLSVHNWDNSVRTFRLDRLDETPVNGRKYAFAIPGGALGGPKTVLVNPGLGILDRDHLLEDGKIYSDHEELYAKFRMRPAVARWEPLLRNAIVLLAAARLCIPLSHDKTLAAELEERAIGRAEEKGKGGLLALAIGEDLAQNPVGSPLLREDPLTMARFA